MELDADATALLNELFRPAAHPNPQGLVLNGGDPVPLAAPPTTGSMAEQPYRTDGGFHHPQQPSPMSDGATGRTGLRRVGSTSSLDGELAMTGAAELTDAGNSNDIRKMFLLWFGDEAGIARHEVDNLYFGVYAAGGGKRNMANFVRDGREYVGITLCLHLPVLSVVHGSGFGDFDLDSRELD